MPPKQGKASSFHILITGQVESASNFSTHSQGLYCRYVLSYGQDWEVVSGMTTGITQMAYSKGDQTVWNFPIEIAFRSTNAHGWPRICFAVYGLDFFGRDVVRGYGSVLLPACSGMRKVSINMYRPISGSWCHEVMNWWRGTLPEFYETAFTAKGNGRAVTRVRSEGTVTIALDVSMKDMGRFGFSHVANGIK